MKLDGKVAIVTGASRGIGKAIAFALAGEGATLVVAARTTQEGGRLEGTIYKTVDEIIARGGKAHAVKADVSNEEEVAAMVKQIIEQCGRVDILVNNAGITVPGTMLDITVRHWDLIMNVNLKGTFLCTRAVLPLMVAQQKGNIINLSSILGTRLIAQGIPYGMTKAAIERFTMGLAREVKKYNIAVNALVPGFTDTEGVRSWISEKERATWQKTELWGKNAVFLACQDVSTMTGQCLTAEEIEAFRKGQNKVK
jgi:NAD(P)-dependent dehydrogenase (short-subunit alcohol dehydrogenase family)